MSEASPKQSHGSGRFDRGQFARIGDGVVIEEGVLVFHPETIELGDHVYVGHQTILKGYYNSKMVIGEGSWIGQQCFLHSGGGLTVGRNVGIGPGVKILTSRHGEAGRKVPILHSPLEFAAVMIEDDSDIGVAAVVLPGVTIGRGAQIGAGSVVTRSVPAFAVAAGVPARVIRMRDSENDGGR